MSRDWIANPGEEFVPRRMNDREQILGLCDGCKRETTTCVRDDTSRYGLRYRCTACVDEGPSTP